MTHRKKILIWSSVFLLVIPLLFTGIWLGVNLWPRKMEPPLWTKGDLEIPDKKDKNGYYFLIQMMENPYILVEFPDELDLMLALEFRETEADQVQFWAEAKELEPTLLTIIQNMMPVVQEYQKLIDFPQFIDQDPISIDSSKRIPWPTFKNLHNIGTLYIIQQMLEGDKDDAYSFWTKRFQIDQSWLLSARGTISHLLALEFIRQDLILLSFMRSSSPRKNQDQILQTLQNFDPEKISFRRALIYQYLSGLNAADSLADSMASEGFKINHILIRILFNRPIFQREMNDQFRRLERLLTDPQGLTDQTVDQFKREIRDLTKGWFWWFTNPEGKSLKQLVSVDIYRIQDFYSKKEEVQKIWSQLLEQPLFPPVP